MLFIPSPLRTHSQGSEASIQSVALSPSGQALVTGDAGGRVVWWVRQSRADAARPAVITMPRLTL